jgi:hypothetical protein
MKDYQEFLQSKKMTVGSYGIEVEESALNFRLFPFQKALTKWALQKGKAALFCECGLGKTPMQLEWAHRICLATDGNVLILAPLAVSRQTVREAAKFDVPITRCRTQTDVQPGINITNYEMLEHFDASLFIGVVWDESSILKSFMGKTKRTIVETFKDTPYKLACTATPAPNDHMELLNHAEALNVMPSNEALARWFILDTMNAGKYRLKHHAVAPFWEWVATWAACVSKPSDLGYDDNGFILPPLSIEEVLVDVDLAKDAGQALFRIPEMSATAYNKEKRLTVKDRAAKAAEIVLCAPDESFAIWCDTNFEADEIKRLLPDAVEIRGSDSTDKKEQAAIDFIEGKTKVLISKSSIFGFGLNFQHCHKTIFCGLSFSYERFYQTTRRFWRFGQTQSVTAYIVLGKSEYSILQVIRRKVDQHEQMKENMAHSVKEFNEITKQRRELKMNYDRQENTGRGWRAILGDSVEEIKGIQANSIGLSIFSPPFSNLYIYSDSIRDMGNTRNDREFFKQFKFLIPEIKRITIPGRLCAVHCKQLVNYKNRDGAFSIRDFRGSIIRAFVGTGWTYHSEVCVWKDPVIEMQRTKSHGLLYCEARKDSTHSRMGLPEYLLLFRKWTDNPDDMDPEPVTHTKENFPLDTWQRWASPVWFDIQQTNVLNVQQARDGNDEKHIAPLQLDVIERAVTLWSNPGDVVFSPFMGIGSEGYMSLKLGRRFLGIELKQLYYDTAMRYLTEAARSQDTLFEVSNG